jgi:hypothetical protein
MILCSVYNHLPPNTLYLFLLSTVPLTSISALTLHEHMRAGFPCCYKEAPHVAITTHYGEGRAYQDPLVVLGLEHNEKFVQTLYHDQELVVLGLEHNEKFVQTLIALRRHAKELQKKTSMGQLMAALINVKNVKSRFRRFPHWKRCLEPIENELLQLVQSTRRIARMPAKAIQMNPLQASSSTSNGSLCMEKQQQHAVPNFQFETMDPVSEIEMVEARSMAESIYDTHNDASSTSIGSTVYSGQPIPDVLESPESLDLVWNDAYFDDREDVAAVFDFDRERLKAWYISS